MSMLPAVIILLGFIAWIVELVAPAKSIEDAPPPALPLLPAIVMLLAITIGGCVLGMVLLEGNLWLGFGTLIGGTTALLAAVLEQRRLTSREPATLAPIGAATIILGALALVTNEPIIPATGALIGGGLMAGLVGRSHGDWSRSAATNATLLAAAGIALLLLGQARPEARLHDAAVLSFGLIALVALILRGIAFAGTAAAKLRLPIGLLLLGGAGAALGQYFELPAGALLPVLGAGAALLGLLLPEDRPTAGPAVLGCLIAIAVATIAFGFAHGTGLALAASCMAALLIASGRPIAAIAATPAVMLAWHRVLQEYGDMTTVLNPNQHYILIGLMLGAGVPALLALSTHDPEGDTTGPWWSIPTALLGMLIAATTPMLLAERAATGYLAGAVIAPFIGLAAVPLGRTLPAHAALSSAVALLVIKLLPPEFLMTRDEKITWLLVLGTLGLLLALPLAFRRSPASPATVSMLEEEAH